ncbi:MAG: type I DNA topoisomerase, partial [Alphaproteobacteria bacterium]|nr:type I DNA topoisomerase [Alphaproteobacteria bacterium]
VDADAVYLAADPDREGESIAWHVVQVTRPKVPVYRVTFNEITKGAIQDAFKSHTRSLDQPLINAYLARRALDYLVGFNLSPVLWRKLPGSRSAGRVQSVALRLICEREAEIEIFKPQEYWSIEAKLHTSEGMPFTAKLTHLAGNKLGKMDLTNESDADHAVGRIKNKALSIQKIEKKQVRRNPAPPFITSTLQMDASRKLGMSASQTMRTAQSLYEAGFITYMRTDGTTLSNDAVAQARDVIKGEYGGKYLPDSPRLFKSKAKNAQEAHEAIRPTDLTKIPGKSGAPMGDEKERRLYELIWKRTMASQMENAVLDQMKVDISDGTDDVILRANGSVVTFDGFLTLYQESTKDEDEAQSDKASDSDRRLPPMNEGENTKLVDTTPNQHFTQPPPRYSEASLVKALEEMGIGRPSTYASIMQVLRDRNYVEMDKRRFVPKDRGRVVTTFLTNFFTKYVDYEFTANLEEELDAIAAGHLEWQQALRDFWVDFKAAVDETKELTITDVINHLDDELGPHFFQPTPDNPNPRECKACKDTHGDGRLGLKLGKFGAFIGCSNYPECKFTRPLELVDESESAEQAELANEPKILGEEPGTGRTVSLRRGPYGPYVQIDPAPESAPDMEGYEKDLAAWEEAKKAAKAEGKKAPKKPKKPTAPKPKRQGLPKGMTTGDVTLEIALELLALPRDIGEHPETGKMIKAGIGRFGPFVQHDGKFASIPKDEDVMTIGMNRAVDLIAKKMERDAAKEAAKAAKEGDSSKKDDKKKTPKKKTAKKSTGKKKSASKQKSA